VDQEEELQVLGGSREDVHRTMAWVRDSRGDARDSVDDVSVSVGKENIEYDGCVLGIFWGVREHGLDD
jgi:hypothetical protein